MKILKRSLLALLLGLFGADISYGAAVPATIAPKKKMRLARIMQSGPLWYFNGEHPTNYDIEVTLSAQGTGAVGTFLWEVVSGADRVNLENNADAMTKTNNNTIRLRSTGASTPAAAVTGDVGIRLTFNSTTIVSYSTAVFAPHENIFLRNDDRADATFGYLTEIHYQLLDQFGRPLSQNVELNERFTTTQTSDYPPTATTWRQGTNAGALVNPVDWHDLVGGENLAFTPLVPTPVSPSSSTASTPVAHWDGEWQIGSTTVGNGRRVQTNRWQKFQGFARHTNVVSPP